MIGATAILAACSGDDDDPGVPLFPDDYAQTYVEVRDCRSSSEHDLNKIRVVADPAALAPYQNRVDEFPVGAVVLKEEYEFSDPDCVGDIIQWTVMARLATGSSPDTLDWAWQSVDASNNVKSRDSARCITCHADCEPPDGYFNTCTVEDGGG